MLATAARLAISYFLASGCEIGDYLVYCLGIKRVCREEYKQTKIITWSAYELRELAMPHCIHHTKTQPPVLSYMLLEYSDRFSVFAGGLTV